jgi:hypothetical protein
MSLSGGDATVGYDYLDGSQPPTWRIWFEGRELIVVADDPGAVALLNSFMLQADNRARAVADFDSARQSQANADATVGLGLVGTGASGGVALISCAGVPLTFWAAGGTGWTCALGIAGAVAGVGTTIVSLVERGQAVSDQHDALGRLETANREVSSLFNALELSSTP